MSSAHARGCFGASEQPSKTARLGWTVVLVACGVGALASLALAYQANAPAKEAVTNVFTALRDEVRAACLPPCSPIGITWRAQAGALSSGVSELTLRAERVSRALDDAGVEGDAVGSSVAPLTELSDKLVDASEGLEGVENDAHTYNGSGLA